MWLTKAEIADAESKSVHQVLVEGIAEIIQIAYENGLTDDEVDTILTQTIADRRKSRFKVLG